MTLYDLIVTDVDIGRAVLYHSRQKDVRPEPGIITSYNADYVFVRFDGDRNSKACRRIDLEYET